MLFCVISDAYEKEKSVFAANDKEYILGGQTVGIRLYSKGIILIDFEEGDDNPALLGGLKVGDMILFADGKAVSDTDSFVKAVTEAEGRIKIVYDRDGKTAETEVEPKIDSSGVKRVGMWVRDSVAGVGTVTLLDMTEGAMVALGHPVTETDTGRSFNVGRGEIAECDIVSVKKSLVGIPGEIYGQFKENGEVYAEITRNTDTGLYASVKTVPSACNERIKIASGREIHNGGAILYSDVSGTVTAYSVKIRKLYSNDNNDFTVEITDSRLIDLTGGIVQGMSGSPIVQGGKIIGALTHMFVNDPTKGYGIYAEKITDG